MDYVLAFLIFGAIIAVSSLAVYETHVKWQKRKMMGFPKESPSSDDCIWQAKKMTDFLYDRLMEAGGNPVAECTTGMKANSFTLGRSHDIVDLVRYAHLAGCRIVIEQVEDHDIETPENTREVLKKYHTDLYRSREERLEDKYSRY